MEVLVDCGISRMRPAQPPELAERSLPTDVGTLWEREAPEGVRF